MVVALILLCASSVLAETDAQFAAAGFNAPRDPNVRGARCSVLYGRNDSVRGVDVGGLDMAQGARVQVGFVNVTKRLGGVQIGFLNVAESGFPPVFP